VFVKYLAKPLYCICYCIVMISVHLCVHYILYGKNNIQLVLGIDVAQLDVYREWSYQVEHGSCGLYVQKMVYIVLESKCPSATPSITTKEGRIQTHYRCFGKTQTTPRS